MGIVRQERKPGNRFANHKATGGLGFESIAGDQLRAPDKNRYLQAARRMETSRVPFQELEFAHPLVEALLGHTVPKVRCYELPGHELVNLYRAAGCDMAYVSSIWELGRQNYIDEQGRKHYVDGLFKTRASLRDIVFPDGDALRRRLDEVTEALAGSGLGLIFAPNPMPFLVTTAIGYQDYYQALYLEPDFVLEFQQRLSDWCFAELDIALEYPVDVVRIGAVLCTKQGPLMNAEMLERFEYPYLRQVVPRIHAKGRLALLHTDGDLTRVLPGLVGMGFEILHPVETCGGVQDIGTIKQRFGDRLAVHGNIDVGSVLAPGTPDDVHRDTLAHLNKLAPGGGYICGSSHDISEDVPLPNLLAMRDTVHSYRLPRQ